VILGRDPSPDHRDPSPGLDRSHGHCRYRAPRRTTRG
jgi:hypothetical protein